MFITAAEVKFPSAGYYTAKAQSNLRLESCTRLWAHRQSRL